MTGRRKGREFALQCLYSAEIGQGAPEDAETKILEGLNVDAESLEYGKTLAGTVLEHVMEIDDSITRLSQNWSLNRIAVIDKILIRCGAAEMFYMGLPAEVSITEAVQLGLKYSTTDSSKFINGVLDTLSKQLPNLKPKD